MLKKKLSALLTAICCLSTFGTTTASAALYVRTKCGGIGYDYRCEMYKGFLVETDGTELTEDMLHEVNGFSQLVPLEDFVYDAPWGHCNVDYQPEGTAYMVGIDSDDPETLTNLGRSFMLSNDCVTQVRLVDFEKYGTAIGASEIGIYLKTPDVQINSETIPELKDAVLLAQIGSYESYALNHTQDCNCELCSDLRTLHVGNYEFHQRVQDYADELAAKYSDLISSATALAWCLEEPYTQTSSHVSIWQSAGDCNADGEVNAQDAAEQLIAAANAATGGEIEITGANDVNADGEVNALDAAAVLAYAAAQGSGQDVSWVEILG